MNLASLSSISLTAHPGSFIITLTPCLVTMTGPGSQEIRRISTMNLITFCIWGYVIFQIVAIVSMVYIITKDI